MNINLLSGTLTLSEQYPQMKAALIFLIVCSLVMIIASAAFFILGRRFRETGSLRRARILLTVMMYVTTFLVVLCTVICCFRYRRFSQSLSQTDNNTTIGTTEATQDSTAAPTENTFTPETENTGASTEPTFTPGTGDTSSLDQLGIRWEVLVNGQVTGNYQHQDKISFGNPEDYFALPGIATFRGDNYRNSPAYGTVTVKENKLEQIWNRNVGMLNDWPGCGWTGQPLMVQWDAETKQIMNLYPAKRDKADLVEVIYATLDGNIYFYDLDDGTYTRDPLSVGMNFKGAGSLDPRGYPIMYVGSGDFIGGKAPRMYMISLIDGTILYESKGTDNDASRSWCAFDSAPLVDAETDTLIWPGENGVLYTIKLNTKYDKSAGTLSIQPEALVKTRYATGRSNNNTYWVGYEPSAVIVDRYLYISENGGMFFCVDLDTMELVWAQDTRDDSNATPVFEWNGQDGGYIYTAPSLHWTSENDSGYICIYKLDAKTGEIVWEKRFDCTTESGVSGGVQASPILGKPGTELEGLVLYAVARNPSHWEGKLVALDTETGEIVWEKRMNAYTWSSPVAVYDKTGKAYIILCDSVGNMFLLDSKGTTLSTTQLGSNIEASPAVFNNTIVVGTRGGLVSGIKIK